MRRTSRPAASLPSVIDSIPSTSKPHEVHRRSSSVRPVGIASECTLYLSHPDPAARFTVRTTDVDGSGRAADLVTLVAPEGGRVLPVPPRDPPGASPHRARPDRSLIPMADPRPMPTPDPNDTRDAAGPYRFPWS